jgi:hypothetical protein
MENQRQITEALQQRVIELEEVLEGMSTDSEKQEQKLETMKQINEILKAKNTSLTEEISSLHVDINITQDQKEKELLIQV